MKFIKSLVISACLISTTANAGLILNGSFESVDASQINLANTNGLGGAVADVVDMGDMDSSGDWGIFASIPNWQTLIGSGLELQFSGTIADAQDGNLYIEMDTDPVLDPSNVGIMQEVNNLVIGNEYELSFWTQGRTLTQGENDLSVSWFDASESYDSHTGTSNLIEQTAVLAQQGGFDRIWNHHVYTFNATSENMNIAFAGAGDATGKGALLDNISLNVVTVSEPSMFVLMLAGLFGLALRRKS